MAGDGVIMPFDPAIRDHQTWLGYLQPEGLVVSAAALVDLQVILPHDTITLQEDFLCLVDEIDVDGTETTMAISDLKDFVLTFLGWHEECLVGLNPERPLPDDLTVPLPEFGETLAPSFAFIDPKPKDPAFPWFLLVQEVSPGKDLDALFSHDPKGWSASPARRFERLLRETKVPIGILSNGAHLRLIYAPRGENAGSLTFPVSAMGEVTGRPILAAFHLLLNSGRLLTGPTEARLPSLLAKSREYQSTVSTALAEQVLDALYELLRGFQAANEHSKGELLRDVLANNPDSIYAALLTVLMRLVFLLYAEDRGLMPGTSLYEQHYSVHGLFKKLREDHEHYPDTIDHRYGAWPRLLALFRAVYDGCRHQQMNMPARHGHLFDPVRFPFLEGRSMAEPVLPLIADGVVYRVLDKLLILDGERLSYRTLDVEQIGSVYETMMGFRLEVTQGSTIAIKAAKRHGAPAAINLDDLLATKGTDRVKWLADRTEQKFSGDVVKSIQNAATLDDLLVSLDRRIARNATPDKVPKGSMVLQPSDERRRSGSHYTPRSLTEPIVRTALRPILEQLGDKSTPEQILELKVADIAVGSGAFLVESCRQLGDELVKAWHIHGNMPTIPPDEDEVLLARRLIAQRCLYGVDKNPMAADLAKLSLWLVTLAKDHPFTFLDHSIRSGDSLVGLTKRQIADFHWEHTPARVIGQEVIEERLKLVSQCRREILDGGDVVSPELKRQKLDLADESLGTVREAADLVIAAFFGAGKDKERKALRNEYLGLFTEGYKKPLLLLESKKVVDGLRSGDRPVVPFHWEIEFPEVFDRENPGFDVIVGNPPFAGKNTLINGNREGYLDWLKTVHEESHGNADLVAHFYRRAFNLLRKDGCFGLIATNTIGQGDTRSTGLRWICTHGGTIYAARKRVKWPGQAAVIVSVVHVSKGLQKGPFDIDGLSAPIITAYLFHAGTHNNPAILLSNTGKSFQGIIVLGMGFTFDDTDVKGIASPISEMQRIIEKDANNAQRILPYLGGEETYESPTQVHHRYVIDFEELPLLREDLGKKWVEATDGQRAEWVREGIVPLDYPDGVAADYPDLLSIVETKVKPERLLQKDEGGRKNWWQFLRPRREMRGAISGLKRVLVSSRVGNACAYCFLPSRTILSDRLVVFPYSSFSFFGLIQSRCHEVWARFFGSTLKDDFMYAPVDCFETFPFPIDFETNPTLEQAGQAYYEFRADLMVRNNEGLTKTYNRFHDPDEASPDIFRLRELHAAMDREVLHAYGWHDIPTNCEFILDYEEEGDNEESNRRRKKPWRYRWPDPIRDEVLARLLALNAERAEEERLAGLAASENGATKKQGRKKSSGTPQNDQLL